jgi:GH15 family glucan-1,4-alpha-glucosidase
MGPVRVGNAAYVQVQHDAYGQIVLSNVQAFFDERLFRKATEEDFASLEKVGELAWERHDEPDAGLWEFRTRTGVHTYSSVMSWAACDRLGNAAEALGLEERAALWRERAGKIRERIEQGAWHAGEKRFAATFGGDDLDASLLTLPLYGYVDAAHPRMAATCARIRERLGRDSLIARYAESTRDGLPAGEGAFGICSFWAVECQARGGDVAGAAAAFERLLGYANDVGLLAEEIDWETGAALGNFPQAFTHVGLINAALTLAECGKEQELSSHVTSA